MSNIFIIRYPGSNCLHDCQHIVRSAFQKEPQIIDYDNCDHQYKDGDFIIIPGGFSFGDISGSGIIAAEQPATRALCDAVNKKKNIKIIGICNGFQILVYAGLLPGSFTGNISGEFVSRDVHTKLYKRGIYIDNYCMPIANGFGRYVFDADLNYQDIQKSCLMLYYNDQDNYSGSDHAIAGISNQDMNIFGIMPHPDRAFSHIVHNTQDGLRLIKFFESL